MAIITEEFDATPDYSLMTKIGKTGYSLAELLAEYVDNSLDARLEGEQLAVQINGTDNQLFIIDNASGMDKQALKDAMVVARSHKANQLGEYGMGLKAASVALATQFRITTTKAGDDHEHYVQWDEQDWESTGKWRHTVLSQPQDKAKHGTVILLQGLRMKLGGRIGATRAQLGRRFGPYIRRGELVLKVNGKACKAPETKLLEGVDFAVENPLEFEEVTGLGHTIKGWVGILESGSQKGDYGFDTFRRGRMITTHDKIAFSPHPTLARIVGEVHADHCNVTVNKREWLPDELYEDMVATLKTIIQGHLDACRKLAKRSRFTSPKHQTQLEQAKSALREAFQSDALKEITAPERKLGGTDTPEPDPGGEDTAELPIEKRASPGKKDEPRKAPEKQGKQRTPKKIQPKTNSMKVKGKRFDYDHSWSSLGAEGPWFEYQWDPKRRFLEIFSNEDSPLIHTTTDPSSMAFLHIVESISQIVLQDAGYDWSRYDDVRQTLILEAGKHLATIRGAAT